MKSYFEIEVNGNNHDVDLKTQCMSEHSLMLSFDINSSKAVVGEHKG